MYLVSFLKREFAPFEHSDWSAGFASFVVGPIELPAHLFVTAIGSPRDQFTRQRDRLAQSPDLIEALNRLKRSFEGSTAWDDYSRAKRAFIRDHLEGVYAKRPSAPAE
jgi:hypothetical protein